MLPPLSAPSSQATRNGRAVRDADPVELVRRVGVGVEMEDGVAVGAVALGEHAQRGERQRVVAAEHERHRAGAEDLAQALGERLVRADEIGGRGGGVAVVDDLEQLERVDAERHVRPPPAAAVVGRADRAAGRSARPGDARCRRRRARRAPPRRLPRGPPGRARAAARRRCDRRRRPAARRRGRCGCPRPCGPASQIEGLRSSSKSSSNSSSLCASSRRLARRRGRVRCAHQVDRHRAHLRDDLGEAELTGALEAARGAARGTRGEPAHLGVAARRLVQRGGERPGRGGQVAERKRQLLGRITAGAQVARHVAGEHARVADGVVDVASAARVAHQLRASRAAARATSGRSRARRPVRARTGGCLHRARAPPASAASAWAGSRLLECVGDAAERAAELAEDRLDRAADEQDRDPAGRRAR